MLSPKLKWPRETGCIPNSTLQPISDQRTRLALVSSPGRDSRDSHSSRLAEATQKALGTNALCTGSRIFIWLLPHIYPIFAKSFF